jgi:hypothetical protein
VKLNLRGRNRFVILTKNYAIKFPSLRCWRDFLFGLLNNLNEVHSSNAMNPALCPVLWALPGGFMIVMPRARIMSEAEFLLIDPITWCADNQGIPAERKADSFGFLEGRLVCVDYGWPK